VPKVPSSHTPFETERAEVVIVTPMECAREIPLADGILLPFHLKVVQREEPPDLRFEGNGIESD
jgi:hypothetical protein